MARIIPNDPLLAIGRIIILIGQAIMGFAAAVLVVGIPLVIFLRDKATVEVRAELGNPDFVFPTLAVVLVMLLAMAIVVMAFLFLDRMRRIVDTVGEGDPFKPENAQRLTSMAWLMLGIQVLAIPAAGAGLYISKLMEETDATVDASIDLSGVVMVVTLFILARVFRKGTEMRADLEGTV